MQKISKWKYLKEMLKKQCFLFFDKPFFRGKAKGKTGMKKKWSQ
jgi:hypothetical protein